MAERDLITTLFDRDVVKNAAAQTRAYRTIRLSFGNQSFNDRIGVALDDPKWNIELAQIRRQYFARKIRLFLVEIYRQNLKIHGRSMPHIEQKIQERMTVFTTGEADHDAVAVVDHSEVGNRFAHAAQQSGLSSAFRIHSRSECHALAPFSNVS